MGKETFERLSVSTMRKKPLIIITGSDHRDRVAHWALNWAVRLAGGKPKKVTPQQRYEGPFEGLILSGGVDVHPARYHSSSKHAYDYELDRDELEYACLEQARASNKPVLGICRGAQLMNVFAQGTLHPDVSKAYKKAQYPSSLLANIFFRKRMVVKQNSLLFKILGERVLKVNSMHTQAVDCLGKDLVMAAAEKNGVIQAIEDPSRGFYLGVQYHPEFLIYSNFHRRLFKALVKQAKSQLD